MTDANLLIVRHGQSEWNRDRRMTGWSDVDLNARGRDQARAVGRVLRAAGYEFDIAFTSWLRRAEETLEIVLAEMGQPAMPVQRSWRLNERHYGVLQGMSRQQAAREFGLRQFATWQNSYAQRPPPVSEDDARFPGNDPRYAQLQAESLPRGESMQDTLRRARPCWQQEIVPALGVGKRVLVVAHKTSIRALRKLIEGISDEQISSLTVETGKPFAYALDETLAVRWQRELIPTGRVKRLAQAAIARWIHNNRSGDRV